MAGGAVDRTSTGRRDARASGLRYVSPDGPGIARRRAGRGFSYVDATGRRVRGAAELARIRAIAVPPAWTEVWICPSPDGHIQAIGRDARGRRQYRYHAGFRARRDHGKFARLAEIGARLPRIRRQVRNDLSSAGLPREKVLAAVVRLLDATGLRVGNDEYARVNRSFGLSTLRGRHARVAGATLRFRFRGKGGRTEERELVDRSLAALVRRCQELPGQELFQYLGDDGEPRPISSEDVNQYLRDAAGTDAISAKDLRTWTATLIAFRELREAGATEAADAEAAEAAKPRRRRPNPITEALRRTAEELNDTLTVTRNSYVHPGVIAAFEAGDQAIDGGPASRGRSRPGQPNRREELDLLALLKRAGGSARASGPARAAAATATRTARAATRTTVDRPRVAARSRRTAA